MDSIKTMTVDYLRTRQQFGTVLGKFQALQHRTAQMLLEIEQAKSAVTNAAKDLNAPTDERNRAISAAKHSIGRIGCYLAEEAIQLHGGIGMTWEYDLGHFAKRLVMIDHEWGDQDHHLMRYAQS
jgi:alkylation response protein AidB-like acyl-CoA dehydrogenase